MQLQRSRRRSSQTWSNSNRWAQSDFLSLLSSVGNLNDLLADGVVSARVIVGGVLLSGDELFGMEELSIGAGANLVDGCGLEIDLQE